MISLLELSYDLMDTAEHLMRSNFRDNNMYIGNSMTSPNRELIIQLGDKEDRRAYCVSVPPSSQRIGHAIQADLKLRLFNVN